MTAPGRRPRVDVGVVTYETAALTTAALRRLLDSDQGCDLRVLVHDNASRDGTPEALARAVPEAQVEVCAENVGFARGMNRLLERSDAPWFVALNSDAWPEPGAIGRLVAAAEAHPKAAVVVPLLRRPDGSVEHSTHRFPSVAVAAVDAIGGRRFLPRRLLEGLLLEGAWLEDRPRAVDWAVGAAWLLRRTATDDVGGFDERFFMYVEDLAWCWEARRRGWTVWFEPAAVVCHVGNASGAQRFGDRRMALEEANLRRWLRTERGRARAEAFRALQLLAAVRSLRAARRRGDHGEADWWRRRLAVLAGLVPEPGPTPLEPRPMAGVERGPTVCVVVPTHNRPAGLGRLLDALQCQTIGRDRFEVVVVDDGSEPEAAAAVDTMAARAQVTVTVVHQPQRGPAAARNVGWRRTAAPVVAFTDDDCVPSPEWLAEGLAALDGRPRVVVGRTGPPAAQRHLLRRPFSRAMVVADTRYGETCNVFFRRSDLAALGGFDERFRRPSGEDTDLLLRATAAGADAVFAERAVVAHDVRPGGFRATLAEATRWADLPLVVRGRLDARRRLAHRWLFWKPTHPPALLAAGALVAAWWWRPAVVGVGPWLACRLWRSPVAPGLTGRIVNLPGAFGIDLVEIATMVRGSVRHRTLLL
jgi:GT2 family glycosyltransferase